MAGEQKLTMSAENFVKLASDAKLLSNQVRATAPPV